ncbi:MAG: YoaK family protein [Mucilaginibacter sp.]|jgi:uncharacterized membrane protein YoaK (UPF0700 family)|uniref:YoaK family protein n=1 Tax=Mucilaginibacter sp. TaxID=1882438 RepID=UPI00356408C6
MLQHIGHKRTNAHNIKLAALLSLTAGFVNAAGFLSFMVLTTNVTGHVALFAEKLAGGDTQSALVVGAWMLLFFAGAFVSSMIINMVGRNQRYAYTIPIIIEIIILVVAGSNLHWFATTLSNNRVAAGSLLFAMGLQNAMVSIISGSVVRTTHLTGMFTDLGIELAASLYGKGTDKKNAVLYGKMFLRLVIIFFFFAGCIASSYIFHALHYKTFYIPAGLLVFGMLLDIFRIKTIKFYRRVKHALTSHAE